jgi:hypothetical protein
MRPLDPIEELHAVREALAKASDNDLAKIVAAAQTRQQRSGHEIVRLPPRPVTNFVATPGPQEP